MPGSSRGCRGRIARVTSTAPGTRWPAPTIRCVNAAVVAEAEARRVWCVRADDGALGSAVTPATAQHEQHQIAVLAGGDFRASRRLRDRLAALLPGLAPTD